MQAEPKESTDFAQQIEASGTGRYCGKVGNRFGRNRRPEGGERADASGENACELWFCAKNSGEALFIEQVAFGIRSSDGATGAWRAADHPWLAQ